MAQPRADARAFFERDRQWCVRQATSVGPRCAELVTLLLGNRIAERLRAAQGVIGSAKTYGEARLEAACERALSHNSPHYTRAVRLRSTAQAQPGAGARPGHGAEPAQSEAYRSCGRHLGAAAGYHGLRDRRFVAMWLDRATARPDVPLPALQLAAQSRSMPLLLRSYISALPAALERPLATRPL